MNTRRELIQIGAALSATSAAGAQEQHHEQPEAPVAARKARYFRPREMDLLAILVEQIIPATETPGAFAANVHYYIDWQAHTNPRLGEQLRKDLAWIEKEKFASKDAAARVDLLTAWSRAAGNPRAVFKRLKDLTIDGYYGTREGLQVELGWNANTFVREFKGCTHPEHA